MQIRQKLTYQFILVVALILFLSSLAIYYFSADYRKDGFYTRLHNKASNTAKLLIEVAEVDANLLKKIETDNPTSLPKEKIIIYNRQDEVLYSTDAEQAIKIPNGLLDSIRSEKEIRYMQGEYEVLGFMFSDKDEGFVVVAGAVDIYGLNKLRNLRTILITVFGVSIILVFISGWVYAGRALQPISRVIDQVDEITITSLNLRVHEGNGQDEIAKLANTFNNMLERLETAFKMQKIFIANASHELRTPLTAITGQLDVALMNERTIVEYQHIMTSVLEDIKNLNHVSNRLLLLAQTTTETTGVDFKPLRADDIIWQVKSELTRRNPDYKIHVSLDEGLKDDSQLTMMGNEQLIKTAINNVVDNGCKYAPDHRVHICIRAKENQIVLEFADKGIGIEPQDLKHIFEPFYRGKNALLIKGHGIGLSLVERIINLHKGTIQVDSKSGQGSTFTISFPLYSF
ncbi:MAG TPA: HAMP domain-containing sensor histidine kinase [Saprospiraceae bacterium]|nr:HAMP domain-containing sensor histidine kinase [Saprospiraceae bacterium]